jgi:hypothetical protein
MTKDEAEHSRWTFYEAVETKFMEIKNETIF